MELPLNPANDRRSDRRYRIEAPLQYSAICDRSESFSGSGTTLNLSNSGVLFETDQTLQEGMDVELSIAWPAKLKDVSVELNVVGTTIRTAGGRIAVSIRYYEYRRTASRDGAEVNIPAYSGIPN
jgi:hypothetical protein